MCNPANACKSHEVALKEQLAPPSQPQQGRCARCGASNLFPLRSLEEEHIARDEKMRTWLKDMLDEQSQGFHLKLEAEHKALLEVMQRDFGQRMFPQVVINNAVSAPESVVEPASQKLELPNHKLDSPRENYEKVRHPQAEPVSSEGESPKHLTSFDTLSSTGSSAKGRPVRTDTPRFIPGRLEMIISSNSFDLGIGFVIGCNTVLMFVELEWEAWRTANHIGIHNEHGKWPGAQGVFASLEHIFNMIFVIELLLKLAVFRCRFFCEKMNVFDCVVVVSTCFNSYLLKPLQAGNGQNFGVARLVRICRVVRIFRIFRAAEQLHDLRVLMRSLASSMYALFWSMVLLLVVVAGSGVLMAQLLLDYLKDGRHENYELNLWIFRHFGGSARATYTMFEATFSGCWPNYARKLVEEVSSLYGLLWVFYVAGVAFPVLSIVRALFLKEAMANAANDHERMVMDKLKQKEKYSAKLRTFFEEADLSGDGRISRAEFDYVMAKERVVAYLEVLELEVFEMAALFNLLNDEEQGVSVDEFLSGALRLKGAARTVDSVVIMHEQHKIHKLSDQINDGMARLLKCHGIETEWSVPSARGRDQSLKRSETVIGSRLKHK